MSESSDLSYQDYCIIIRNTHETNKWGSPVGQSEIYKGQCDFQPGKQVNQSIVTSKDVVYLPKGVKVRSGDSIRIEPKLANAYSGVVEFANILELELTDDVITEIEVKQNIQHERLYGR